jgi:hypothetical protein
MKKQLKISLLISAISFSAHSSTPPYKPIQVQISNKEQNSKTLVKYRIVLSAPLNQSTYVNNITICSKKKCYNSNGNKKIVLEKTPTVVVSYLIPRTEVIENIFFEPQMNQPISINGKVSIKDPINLLETVQLPHNVDILVTLSEQNRFIIPNEATAMFNTKDATNIFYDPRIGLKENLPYGVMLNIPKDALTGPKIFNISVNDNGSVYPSIDIYPRVNFRTPISVTTKYMDNSNHHALKQIFDKKTPDLSPSAVSSTSQLNKSFSENSKTESTISLISSGFIDSSRMESASYSSKISATSSTETCAAEIARQRSSLISQTSQTGVVKIDWCLDKPPYAHIVLINKLHPKIKYTIEHGTSTNTSYNIWGVPMFRLNTFANEMGPRAIVAMNGFTWYGPPGIIADTYGFPLGHVKSSNYISTFDGGYTPIGVNRQQGGNITKNSFAGSSDGNKFVMRHVLGSPNVSFFESNKIDYGSAKNPENTVSSSTSIVKNNTCSTGSTDRWSSVGASNELMLMISTASGKESNSSDFCSIYQSFGILNALRLDGGGSTSMIVNGKLLNPNTGSKRLVFGDMRFIPYALKISN